MFVYCWEERSRLVNEGSEKMCDDGKENPTRSFSICCKITI